MVILDLIFVGKLFLILKRAFADYTLEKFIEVRKIIKATFKANTTNCKLIFYE
jgi:hypothetical protein